MVARYLPATQPEQAVTPAALIVPARHFEHAADPTLAPSVPARQAVQVAEPVAAVYVPVEHATQVALEPVVET